MAVVFSSGFDARYFFSTESRAAARGFVVHPFRALEHRAGGGGAGLGIDREPFAIRDHRAAVFVVVRRVLRLVGDVADEPLREQQRADRLGIGARVDLAFLHRQPEFAGGIDAPLDLAPRVDAVRADARGWRK